MSYGERPEALDTRWILRGYAILAGIGGLLLIGWGPMWLGTDFDGERWAKAALIRVFAAIFVAAACCAAAIERVDYPPDRRRALIWFTAAHGLITVVLFSQQAAIWGPGLGEKAADVMAVVTVLLLYLVTSSAGEPLPKTLTTLFGAASRSSTTAELRSSYERQIREAARQEERNRLASDLHDSIKQQIFVVQTSAATAQARLETDSSGTREALEQVRSAAREAMTEMQAMLDQLRAVPLENAGLIEALKRQCEALQFRSGARVDFQIGSLPPAESMAPGAHQAILRVAQEALANIGRHARAQSVRVGITTVQGTVQLRIEDDGAGFDPATAARGQGIANMHSRADEFGGTFELNSRPGGGTLVVFAVPYIVPEPPEEYKRKAMLMAALSVLMIAMSFQHITVMNALVAAIASIWSIRYVFAWLRVRGGAR